MFIKMKRATMKSVKLPIGTKAKIYPVYGSHMKDLAEVDSVGFGLTKQQAIELAINLLAAAQQPWKQVDITGYRKTGQITVTGIMPLRDQKKGSAGEVFGEPLLEPHVD
jgi:hypothetical protein